MGYIDIDSINGWGTRPDRRVGLHGILYQINASITNINIQISNKIDKTVFAATTGYAVGDLTANVVGTNTIHVEKTHINTTDGTSIVYPMDIIAGNGLALTSASPSGYPELTLSVTGAAATRWSTSDTSLSGLAIGSTASVALSSLSLITGTGVSPDVNDIVYGVESTGEAFQGIISSVSGGTVTMTILDVATAAGTPGNGTITFVDGGGTTKASFTVNQSTNTTVPLANVAYTGAYADLSGTPTIPAAANDATIQIVNGGTVLGSFTTDQSTAGSIDISSAISTPNNGTLTIQKNGTNVATFTANQATASTANITVPTKTSDITNDSNFVVDASYVHTDNNYTNADQTKLAGIPSNAAANVQADWNQTTTTADDYIKNKPTIPTNTSDLTNDSGFVTSTYLTTNNYVTDTSYVHTDNNYTNTDQSKLAGIEAGAEVNVNADWNATSGDAQILNKPVIPSAANDATIQIVNGATVLGSFTTDQSTAGSINIASAIPTVYDSTISFQLNGVAIGSITTNQNAASTINIPVNTQTTHWSTSTKPTSVSVGSAITVPDTSLTKLVGPHTSVAEEDFVYGEDASNQAWEGIVTGVSGGTVSITVLSTNAASGNYVEKSAFGDGYFVKELTAVNPATDTIRIQKEHASVSGGATMYYNLDIVAGDGLALDVDTTGTFPVFTIDVDTTDPSSPIYSIVNDISTINTTLTTITSDISTINSSLTTIIGDISTINTTLTTVQGDITNLQTSISTINSSLTTITGDISTINTTLTTVQGDITTIQGNISTINTTLTTVQGDITNIQSDITSIQGDITTIQGDITTINTTLTTLTAAFGDGYFVKELVAEYPNSNTIRVKKTHASILGGLTNIYDMDIVAGDGLDLSVDTTGGYPVFTLEVDTTSPGGAITNIVNDITTITGDVTNLTTTINNMKTNLGDGYIVKELVANIDDTNNWIDVIKTHQNINDGDIKQYPLRIAAGAGLDIVLGGTPSNPVATINVDTTGPTSPIGNGTISFTLNGVAISGGSFTTNQSGNTTIDIPVNSQVTHWNTDETPSGISVGSAITLSDSSATLHHMVGPNTSITEEDFVYGVDNVNQAWTGIVTAVSSPNVSVTILSLASVTSTTWGSIGGTLANQSDLQTALDAKVDESAFSFTSGYAVSELTATLINANTTLEIVKTHTPVAGGASITYPLQIIAGTGLTMTPGGTVSNPTITITADATALAPKRMEFVGDNTNTTLTLPTTLTSGQVATADVYINGLLQATGDYTLSTSTFTFTSWTLDTSDQVIIKYF